MSAADTSDTELDTSPPPRARGPEADPTAQGGDTGSGPRPDPHRTHASPPEQASKQEGQAPPAAARGRGGEGPTGERLAADDPNLGDLADRRVVVLPDLFVDALTRLPAWRDTSEHLDRIAERGGGNLPVDDIELTLGGNAANLAVGLARLGADVDLIAETDGLGQHLLERALGEAAIRTEGLRVGARRSTTVSLECPDANVMLSHAGPLHGFGPDQLAPGDWRLIEEADAVAVTNWAQNREGSRLLEAISTRLDADDVFVYVDTGDPRHRGDDARRLVASDEAWSGVDAWGLNENELDAFAGDPEDPTSGARALADRLGVRLDVHTQAWAATTAGDEPVRVETSPVGARRLTGAGDAWNAGNLAGHLLGWPARRRLALAHRVAGLYVSSPDGRPPTLAQVQEPIPRGPDATGGDPP